MNIRSAYSERSSSIYPPENMEEKKLQSRTQQHFAGESDINRIVAKAKKGIPLPVRMVQPIYGNFENGDQFQESMNRIAAVRQHFESLPSAVRRQFDNNPSIMLDWLADAENVDEAVKLGLLPKEIQPPAAVEPDKAPVPAKAEDDSSKPSPKPGKASSDE